jgi:hypothetical protein
MRGMWECNKRPLCFSFFPGDLLFFDFLQVAHLLRIFQILQEQQQLFPNHPIQHHSLLVPIGVNQILSGPWHFGHSHGPQTSTASKSQVFT